MEIDKDIICRTINGKPVKPKTLGQKQYIDLIRKKMIVFGVGPAGTGKTYLGMSMAIQAFKNGEVNRIILTRPAIEAGEKLGFLPGDMKEKLDPYLQPLYDALNDMIPPVKLQKFLEEGTVQTAPLATCAGGRSTTPSSSWTRRRTRPSRRSRCSSRAWAATPASSSRAT